MLLGISIHTNKTNIKSEAKTSKHKKAKQPHYYQMLMEENWKNKVKLPKNMF